MAFEIPDCPRLEPHPVWPGFFRCDHGDRPAFQFDASGVPTVASTTEDAEFVGYSETHAIVGCHRCGDPIPSPAVLRRMARGELLCRARAEIQRHAGQRFDLLVEVPPFVDSALIRAIIQECEPHCDRIMFRYGGWCQLGE